MMSGGHLIEAVCEWRTVTSAPKLDVVGWEARAMNGQPGGLVLELQCVLDAPRERIFRTLTEPAELAKWWGPHGFRTPQAELDLSVGGGYRFTMQPPDGDLFHLSGEFLEIEPPSRLVYTFRWEEPDSDDRETVVVLSLDDVGDATDLSLSQGEFATEARLALHRSGWTDALEKLRKLMHANARP
jgi:uncharacterized protein YndB with AHSA1/START domain